jgi:hypothetical protein
MRSRTNMLSAWIWEHMQLKTPGVKLKGLLKFWPIEVLIARCTRSETKVELGKFKP